MTSVNFSSLKYTQQRLRFGGDLKSTLAPSAFDAVTYLKKRMEQGTQALDAGTYAASAILNAYVKIC